MIFAVLAGGLPNRITAVAISDVTFVPTRSGYFQEPGLIRYISVTARVMTESESLGLALDRVDRLTATDSDEPSRDPGVIAVDVAAMPGADHRLADLVAVLPLYRKGALILGRVALKSTAPALGRLPGVIGRAELINGFNARAVAAASEDPHDPARTSGKVIPSFRHYAPEEGDLSRDDVRARLSAAERLDVKKLLDKEDALVELNDDETVAAAVMLTMTAADFYAPSAPALNDRFRSFRLPGLA